MPRFELLSGVHNEGGKTYYPGDVFDSARDLSKHPYNRPNAFRFRALSTGPVEAKARNELDSMTVAELKQYAEAEEIDLGDATKRAEILALCRGEVSLA